MKRIGLCSNNADGRNRALPKRSLRTHMGHHFNSLVQKAQASH